MSDGNFYTSFLSDFNPNRNQISIRRVSCDAIHTPCKQNRDIWVERFVSDDIDLVAVSPESKFLQAVRKLVRAVSVRSAAFGFLLASRHFLSFGPFPLVSALAFDFSAWRTRSEDLAGALLPVAASFLEFAHSGVFRTIGLACFLNRGGRAAAPSLCLSKKERTYSTIAR
jgi:hypothetical protein